MKNVKLDPKAMLGFKILDMDKDSASVKLGAKPGVKDVQKISQKIGVKIGLKGRPSL